MTLDDFLNTRPGPGRQVLNDRKAESEMAFIWFCDRKISMLTVWRFLLTRPLDNCHNSEE